jgi:outer membrane receptor protein involved in Fe transport
MKTHTALIAALLLVPAAARAQTQSGVIQGTVSDPSGAPLELVTVIATSPALQQPQTEFTDAGGQYQISGLAPGTYSMLFVYGDAKVRRENVEVSVGKATVVAAKIDAGRAEEIVIKVKPPAIDGASTKLGNTMGRDALTNLPNPGRTFAGVLDSAAGSQGDALGESFSGSTSVENSYVVDGVDTTGLTAGGIGLPVVNNFIQEVEVITGGYNAEFGRSTGGVVNVVTKTGSNELHGSVWGNLQPFEAGRDRVSTAGSALARKDQLDMNLDFGFELGGPIVKDRLWFYVGFAPIFARQKTTRVTGTRVDRNVRDFDYGAAGCAKNADGTCDGDGDPATSPRSGCEKTRSCESDGQPDLDPATGFAVVEEIDRRDYTGWTSQYQFTGKLNFAASPDHQGQVSLTGVPTVATQILTVAGTESATQARVDDLTTDAAAKWTSKLLNNRLQIDAVLGWHRDKQDARSVHDRLPGDPTQRTADTPTTQVVFQDPATANLGVLGHNRDVPESEKTLAACSDDSETDLYPGITNCPVSAYSTGGPGTITDRLESRVAGKLTVTQRVRALGHHQLKAGLDFEDNMLTDRRNYTGGQFNQSFDDWEITRFVRLDPRGKDVCGYDTAGNPRMCDYLDQLPVHGKTLNLAAFLQDSWSPLPNLTFNAGVRWEIQRLGYADEVQSTLDPITGRALGDTALALNNLIAPRIGAIYDWTKEGRSKLYASWGRFYESIPMDINERSFGGEAQYSAFWDWQSQCGAPSTDSRDPALPSLPSGCPRSPSADGMVAPGFGDALIGGNDQKFGIPSGATLIIPGIDPQYMDELVVGVEYELLEDLRVGLSYQNRRLGRVIEDLSTDGGNTFFLANPGEIDGDAIAALEKQVAGMEDGPARDQLRNRVELFKGVTRFDKPSRNYDALQLTVAKRFSRALMLQGSYTYSKLRGNFPGEFSPDTGQLDPNISSQYDLAELLSNRNGALPHDRPHSFKLDGFYAFDLGKVGLVTTGARLRAQSGSPTNTLGRHASYGALESFILPRGSAGRTAFEANADLHVAWARRMAGLGVELSLDLFNLLNTQEQTAVDNEYTTDVVDPIVGGTAADLPYLVRLNGPEGSLARRKQNFGNTTVRSAPLSARVGVTLSF